MTKRKGKDNEPSMFKSLLDKARSREAEIEPEVAAEPETTADEAPNEEKLQERRGPGRPRGRRSDPDYTQISAYVPLDLYLEVQELLLKERKLKRQRRATDVSGLVEQLLREWVNQRQDE